MSPGILAVRAFKQAVYAAKYTLLTLVVNFCTR